MRFYRMGLGEYRDLTLPERNELWQCITIIEAQEMLNQVLVVTMPKLKKEARAEAHKNLHKKAFPDLYDTPKNFVTLEEVQSRLAKRKG